MERPFRVRHGTAVGWAALVLSAALALLYLPFSPSALVWPWEWGIFLGWSLAGAVLYGWARRRYSSDTIGPSKEEL